MSVLQEKRWGICKVPIYGCPSGSAEQKKRKIGRETVRGSCRADSGKAGRMAGGKKGKKKRISTRMIAMMALMIALALVFSYVEALIPINFGVPGIKLGLANLAIVAALYLMGAKYALVISVARIILSGFLFGNMASIIYSLAGGLLSLGVMVLLKRTKKLSIVPVSVCGGIFHNIGQLIVAMLVVENASLAFYLPALLIAGFLTGLLIGIVSQAVLPRIRKAYRAG